MLNQPWGPTRFLREKPWGRGWCSIRIVEDVGRGHFLFLTYLGRSKETQWFDKKKHKVKTLEIRITQIFWPVSRLDSAWNLKVRIQFSSIKKVVSGYLRVVVIFNFLLTHISKHFKIYIAWNSFTVHFNSNIKNPLVDIKLSAQAPIIVGIANHCANSRLNWIQVSLSLLVQKHFNG